jgi:hypothetical protein
MEKWGGVAGSFLPQRPQSLVTVSVKNSASQKTYWRTHTACKHTVTFSSRKTNQQPRSNLNLSSIHKRFRKFWNKQTIEKQRGWANLQSQLYTQGEKGIKWMPFQYYKHGKILVDKVTTIVECPWLDRERKWFTNPPSPYGYTRSNRSLLGQSQWGFHVTIFNTFKFWKQCRRVSSSWNSLCSHETLIISLHKYSVTSA